MHLLRAGRKKQKRKRNGGRGEEWKGGTEGDETTQIFTGLTPLLYRKLIRYLLNTSLVQNTLKVCSQKHSKKTLYNSQMYNRSIS